ncbi:biopolymer transporter ExbD [Romeria aff. gracilis LEGE 07310]|uniref:Biopolymer transporter ExbD n=1 Tax=Vasconcelosia minhoensis LEGE 07310 TaxID=915328 RepID=A0A8J7AM92_9CYAN|nr:biopolymer transporter ExbD [Romeria gracilis]MBE9077034.1 biopolymer transporter ExbD [Romeria aff. gracilis LEGE 07310]
MRLRSRNTPIPTIDLIPMLTVMMGVLAFFVVLAVSLGSEQLIEIQLPPESSDPPPAEPIVADPFIVEVDSQGQRLLNQQPIEAEQLNAEIQAYLARSPENTVYLLPSQELPYETVMQFLGEMRAVGGDRVSLAIEEP